MWVYFACGLGALVLLVILLVFSIRLKEWMKSSGKYISEPHSKGSKNYNCVVCNTNLSIEKTLEGTRNTEDDSADDEYYDCSSNVLAEYSLDDGK